MEEKTLLDKNIRYAMQKDSKIFEGKPKSLWIINFKQLSLILFIIS